MEGNGAGDDGEGGFADGVRNDRRAACDAYRDCYTVFSEGVLSADKVMAGCRSWCKVGIMRLTNYIVATNYRSLEGCECLRDGGNIGYGGLITTIDAQLGLICLTDTASSISLAWWRACAFFICVVIVYDTGLASIVEADVSLSLLVIVVELALLVLESVSAVTSRTLAVDISSCRCNCRFLSSFSSPELFLELAYSLRSFRADVVEIFDE